MLPWREIFLVLLLFNLLCELLLAWRHVRHVQRHQHAVPAPFASVLTLAEHQKAAQYTVWRTSLGGAHLLVGAAVLWGWTLGGGLEALDIFWRARIDAALPLGTCVVLSFLAISMALTLPLSLVRTFWVEAHFGFNQTTWRLFVADLAKGAALMAIIATPLCYGVLAFLQHAPRWGWLSAWGLWSGLTLAMAWIFPTWIAPLFNKFRPLEDPTLMARVRTLLDRCGFFAKGVFIMDGSRRSRHGNAYFTGFGKNKRVVFFDTLLETLSVPEIEGVLAHELGHFKLHHIRNRLVWGFASSFVGFYLLGWLIQQPQLYASFGVTHPSAHAALLLFVLGAPVVTFLFTPLASWYSRRHEYEADAYAAAHADGSALAQALSKLYRDNASTLTPDPWHSAFYDSHPPALARISRLP